MISKLLIVDVNVSDEVKSLLEVLKEDSVLIMYYDYIQGFIVGNENLLVNELLTLIRNHLETSTVNFDHICFMNFEQMKTPMHSFKYNNEVHAISGIESKPEKLESWNFMGKLVADIAKTTEIRNIDFIDIDHLYFPKEHTLIFDKIKEVTKDVEERAINYLKVAEDDKETIYNSENWLHTMFTTFYSDENKALLDKYFKVNNSNIGFLNTKIMKPRNLKIYHSHVPNIDFESDKELNVSIIPLHGYENETDYNLMGDFVEFLNNNTIVEFVYITDTMEDFTTRLTNTINKHCGENKDKINKVNVGFWLNPNISNPALMLSNHISANIDQELLEVVNQLMTNNTENVDQLKNHFIVKTSEAFIDIFNMNVYDNMDVNTINFEIFNISDTFNTNYNLLCQFLHNDYFISTLVNFNLTFLSYADNTENLFELHNKIEEFDEHGIVIDISYNLFKDSQLITDISNNEAYQDDMFITNISHINKSIQYNNDINMAVYLKSDGPEIDKFMKQNIISNVILYDRELHEHLADARECLLPNTLLLTFDKQNTYQDIKDGLLRINELNGVQISNVALFQDNKSMSKIYNLVNEESSIIKYPRFDDPSLNTWSKFQDFVSFLESELSVKYFDLMMCKIYSNPNWRYVIDTISSNLSSLIIRSSENNTGHTLFEGDWILESPLVDVNMINLYFKESIKELDIQLGDIGEQGNEYFNQIKLERDIMGETDGHINTKEIEVWIDGTNVALGTNGATSTASSKLGNNDDMASDKVHDGNANTFWHTGTQAVGQYVTITLAQEYLIWDIEAVVLYHRKNDHDRHRGTSLNLYKDDVLVSNVITFPDTPLVSFYRIDGYSINNVSNFSDPWDGSNIISATASDMLYVPYDGETPPVSSVTPDFSTKFFNYTSVSGEALVATEEQVVVGSIEPKLMDANGDELPYNTYTENSIEYKSYSFTTVGTTSVSLSHDTSVDFMIVAGGGGGGGGAAGGGGVVVGTEYMLGSGNYDITVGSGGHAGPLSDSEINEVFLGTNVLINTNTVNGNDLTDHLRQGGSWYESVVRNSGMNGGDSFIEGGNNSFKALGGAGGIYNYVRNSGGSNSGSLNAHVTINSEYPRGYDDNGDLFDIIGGQSNYSNDSVTYHNVIIYGNEGGVGLHGLGWTNAGGGGAGSAGGAATGTIPTSTYVDAVGGKGGDGLANTFVDGTTQYYGAGGPGSVHDPKGTDGVAGLGGVAVGVNAPANTGAGGSSNGDGGSGAGGSGIVVIRFPKIVNEYETKATNVFTESTTAYLNYDISGAEIKKYVAPAEHVSSNISLSVIETGLASYTNLITGTSSTDLTTSLWLGDTARGLISRTIVSGEGPGGESITRLVLSSSQSNMNPNSGTLNDGTPYSNKHTSQIIYYEVGGSNDSLQSPSNNPRSTTMYTLVRSTPGYGNQTLILNQGRSTYIGNGPIEISEEWALVSDIDTTGDGRSKRYIGFNSWDSGTLYIDIVKIWYFDDEVTYTLPTASSNETTETTEVSTPTFSLSSGVYNIVVDKPAPPVSYFKHVVLQRMTHPTVYEPIAYAPQNNFMVINEVQVLDENGTNILSSGSGAALWTIDFQLTDNVGSWTDGYPDSATAATGPNAMIDGNISGTPTRGNNQDQSVYLSWAVTLPTETSVNEIKEVKLYQANENLQINPNHGDLRYRSTGFRFLFFDASYNLVLEGPEITTPEDSYTFAINEFTEYKEEVPDVSDNIVVDTSTNTITSNVDFEIKYTPIDLSLSELTKYTTINPVRSQTIPFVKSTGVQEERSVTLHGDATYNRFTNEYYFPGDLSGYASIEGQLFGEHAMSMSFMYKSGGEQPVLETIDNDGEIKHFSTNGTLTLTEDATVDILIVGGGGAGGHICGGGGGAGGVVYTVNQTMSAGTYNVVVGVGGQGQLFSDGYSLANNGQDSYISDSNGNIVSMDIGGVTQELKGLGGGGGSVQDHAVHPTGAGNDGGSGGGAGGAAWNAGNGTYYENPPPGGISTQGNTFYDASSQTYIKGGADGLTYPSKGLGSLVRWPKGGGGGGMGPSNDDGSVYAGHDGNDGIYVDICGGITLAAGGGGAQYSHHTTVHHASDVNYGKGGSGIGGDGVVYDANNGQNVYWGVDDGSQFYERGIPISGLNGTGSGGGGWALQQKYNGNYYPAGSGGSGIVIIKIHPPPSPPIRNTITYIGHPYPSPVNQNAHDTNDFAIYSSPNDQASIFYKEDDTSIKEVPSSVFGHVTNYNVTVSSKTSNHPYINNGSSSGYYLNGVESPLLSFIVGETYIFDQSDSTNSGHPLKFYTSDDKSTGEYATDVSINGIAGTSGATTTITITENTPMPLYYQCGSHGFMGYKGSSSNYTHIAITMNEDLTLNETNGFKLYVDGTLTKSGNLSANNGALISGVTQPLQLLGKGPLAGSSQMSVFKGYLKNVRFYDSVLSQSEVSTIYTNMITNEYTDNKNFVSQVVPNLVISSSDISSGDHTELTSISMDITATPDSSLNITSSDINVTNGTISNFTNDTTNTWSFTFTPTSSNIKSSVSISENSLLDNIVNNMADKPSWFTTNNNHASNEFEFMRTNVEMDLMPPLQDQTIAMITNTGSHIEIPVTLNGGVVYDASKNEYDISENGYLSIDEDVIRDGDLTISLMYAMRSGNQYGNDQLVNFSDSNYLDNSTNSTDIHIFRDGTTPGAWFYYGSRDDNGMAISEAGLEPSVNPEPEPQPEPSFNLVTQHVETYSETKKAVNFDHSVIHDEDSEFELHVAFNTPLLTSHQVIVGGGAAGNRFYFGWNNDNNGGFMIGLGSINVFSNNTYNALVGTDVVVKYIQYGDKTGRFVVNGLLEELQNIPDYTYTSTGTFYYNGHYGTHGTHIGIIYSYSLHDGVYPLTDSSEPEQKYTHMAITVKEGQVKRFYINGEVVDYVNKYRSNALPVSRAIVGGKRQHQLFGYGYAANRGFSGLMKNIRIYNKALTAYEMRHLYAINSNFNDNDFSNTILIPVPRPTLTFSAPLPESKILDDNGSELAFNSFVKDGKQYKAYSFTNTGTTSITLDNDATEVEILIVGGGGAGGAGHMNGGGGGGGGVVYAVNQTLTAGSYNIVVGDGGESQQSSTFSGWPAAQPDTNGENGENSEIQNASDSTSILLDLGGVSTSAIGYGGGAGGSHLKNGEGEIRAGEAGGSGGGSGGKFSGKSDFPATRDNFIGGASSQGNTIYDPSTQTYISGGNAGNGTSGFPNGVSHPQVGGGGGGAGGTDDNTNPGGLNGQDGVSITINNLTYQVGGGGGGSQLAYNDSNHGSSNSKIQSAYSKGGLGGGGNGLIYYTAINAIGGSTDQGVIAQHVSSGSANTGGGGGGFNNLALISDLFGTSIATANETTKPGNGGSGIVIIQFPKSEVVSGSSLAQSTLDLKLTASDDGLDGNITANDIITSNGTITAFSQSSPTTWDLTYTSDYNKQSNVGSLFIEQDTIYNKDVSDAFAPEQTFRHVVLYKAQPSSDFGSTDWWIHIINIREVRCIMNDGTNAIVSSNGTSAVFSTNFTHDNTTASAWTEDITGYVNGNDIRTADRMNNGSTTDQGGNVSTPNGGNSQASQYPVHWIATMPSDRNVSDIDFVDFYNSVTGSSMWRAAGFQILLLDSDLKIVGSSSVTSTASSVYTFSSSPTTTNIFAGGGGLNGTGGTQGTAGGSNRHKTNGTYDFRTMWNGTLSDMNDTWGSYANNGNNVSSYYLYFTFPGETVINKYFLWKRVSGTGTDQSWSEHAPGTWQLRGTNNISGYNDTDSSTYDVLDSRTVSKTLWDTVTLQANTNHTSSVNNLTNCLSFSFENIKSYKTYVISVSSNVGGVGDTMHSIGEMALGADRGLHFSTENDFTPPSWWTREHNKASNRFEWTALNSAASDTSSTPTRPSITFSSPDLNHGESQNFGTISMTIYVSSNNLNIEQADLSFSNGVVSDFTKVANNYYTFNFKSASVSQPSIIEILQDTVSNAETSNDFNEASNTFEWTWGFTVTPPDVTITSSDVTHGGNFSGQQVNMILEFSSEVLHGNSVESTFSQFDVSATNGYVFDISIISQSQIAFKLGSSSITESTSIFIPQNIISRTFNDIYTVNSNNTSNVFTWSYDSADLTITSLVVNDANGNTISAGDNINANELWLQFTFSESIYNFDKSYFNVTNCKITNISTDTTFTAFTIKTETYFPTSAIIELQSNKLITTGRGLQKYITGSTNLSFNWNYDNTRPKISMTSSQASGLTNNVSFVDLSFVSTMDTSDFTISSIQVTGHVTLSLTAISSTEYLVRVTPLSVTTINITVPENAYTEQQYGNGNENSVSFNWTYDNIPPTVDIFSPDIANGASSSDPYINIYFTISKPVDDFVLSDDANVANGTLGAMTKTNTFVNHTTSFNVTVASKTASHPYNGNGSSAGYFLNGVESPTIDFIVGQTYTFDQSDSTNSTHPLKFYTTAEKDQIYTSGVVYTYNAGTSGAITTITIDENTPSPLYYQCGHHGFMGFKGEVSHKESYTAKLYPTQNDTVSVYVFSNSITDSAGNTNVVDSNEFDWIFDSNDLLTTLSSSDVTNNGTFANDSITLSLATTAAIVDFVEADISYQNGNISNVDSSAKTFTITSNTQGVPTTAFIIDGAVETSLGEPNIESNLFTWTYNPPIPKLVITSSHINEGNYTNISTIDFTLTFDQANVVFDQNSLTLSNCTISSFSGSGTTYQVSVNVPLDTDDAIRLTLPQGGAHVVDNGTHENDVSYDFEWYYDSIAPVITIGSSFVSEGELTNLKGLNLTVTSSEKINDLRLSDFGVSNAVVSNLSDTSGTSFTMSIQPLDDTTDCSINIFLKDNSVTDRAGNANGQSNTFAFSYEFFSSKEDSSAIEQLFDLDDDIPDEDKLSSSEIDLVISAAFTIPDTASPFAVAATENSNAGGNNTSDDNNTSTTRNPTFVKPPKITIPPEIKIRNRKVFTKLIDQIFATASESVKTLTIDKSSVAVTAAAEEQIAEVEEVVMVKSNQLEALDMSTLIEDPTKPSATYIPLANVNDFAIITIDGVTYTTRVESEGVFTMSSDDGGVIDNPDSLDGKWRSNDIYQATDINKIIFGSQIISTDPVAPEPPTLTITSGQVSNGGTTDISYIDLSFVFSTSVEISLNSIEPLNANTLIISRTIESIDSSNSYISVTAAPSPVIESSNNTIGLFVDVGAFYDTNNTFNDVQYTYSWNYSFVSDSGDSGDSNSSGIDIFGDIATQSSGLSQGLSDMGWEQSTYEVDPNNNVFITNFMKDLTDQPFHPGSDYMSFNTVYLLENGANGTEGDLTNCWIEKQLSGSGTFILEWAYVDPAHAQVSLNSVVIEDYPATYAGNGPPAYGLVTTTGSYSDGDVIRIAAAPAAFVKSFTYNGSSGGSSSGSSSSSLPCFLEGTRILTSNGYKNIELLDPKKDKLLDKDNKPLNFLDIQKYSQENNGNQYPYKIPIGSELSAEYICNCDLYLTYNHCVYLPHLNKYAPVSAMKHLKEDKTLAQKKFTYYHIFTENYFSDTIMANGIPCESHSKYTFKKLRNIDPSCKLLKNVIKKAEMLPNCMRNRLSIKETKQIIKKFQSKQNKKKAKQMKKK